MGEIIYLQPDTIDDASAILKTHPKAKVLAGGTDLVLAMERKKIAPSHLVDLSGIPLIDQVVNEEGKLRLGAMATIQELVESSTVTGKFPVIATAASYLGCWQVRNRATLGGNLANAAPSAEMAPPLMALDAEVKLVGPEGERILPLKDFMTGPGQTALRPGELLTEILVPVPAPEVSITYMRHALRKSMDIALVNVSVYLKLDGDMVTDGRVVLGAVAPTPIRASLAEGELIGKRLDETTINAAAKAAANECRPITDVRATAGYRREMVEVLVRRFLASLGTQGGKTHEGGC